MIPKTIHYCWLSEESFPKEIQACMDSWKKILPDFEIKSWSAENFDMQSNTYVRQANENKKWAFASDYIKLYALYHNELISPVLYVKQAEKYGFMYTDEKQILQQGITLYGIDQISPLPQYLGPHTKLVHCCTGSWRGENRSSLLLAVY